MWTPTCAIALTLAASASAAATIELLGPSLSPSSQECAALVAHNTSIQQQLVKKHSACLGTQTSREDYLHADPCAKQSCRPIHEQMTWASQQISAIDRECRSRIADRTREVTNSPGQDEAGKSLLVRADELLSNAQRAVGVIQNRDRPWSIAEMAWGEGAAKLRRELADRVSGGATRNNLDWDVYDLIFNRSYDQSLALAQTARNPIAQLINAGMLSKLYATHAQLYGSLQASLAAMDAIGSTMPALPPGNKMPPVFYPASNAGSRGARPGTASDCDVFADVETSSGLLARDPATWLALNERCNGRSR